MRFVFSLLSHVGRVRSGNEDCAHARLDPTGTRGLLLIVADGLGGAAGGEVASRMAVQTIDDIYFTGNESPGDELLKAVLAANARIAYAAENSAGSKGMGTTCTALAIAGHTAHLVHVGDSRAYLLRGATMTRLTRDMSVWAERVRDGVMPSSAYGRNQLAAALGLDAVSTPQTRTVDVASGDRFLLCSDGLWGLVTDPELLQIVRAAALDAACRKLIDLANRRGGPDNVSVVLASVDG